MVAVYRWLRILFDDAKGPILLSLILIVWHPKIWEAANRLTSDLWFTGLVGVFMFLLYSGWRNNMAKNLTLGLLVFMATSTRTNGVFLVVPWVLLIWQENPKFQGVACEWKFVIGNSIRRFVRTAGFEKRPWTWASLHRYA